VWRIAVAISKSHNFVLGKVNWKFEGETFKVFRGSIKEL
jgi:hypothetical protein